MLAMYFCLPEMPIIYCVGKDLWMSKCWLIWLLSSCKICIFEWEVWLVFFLVLLVPTPTILKLKIVLLCVACVIEPQKPNLFSVSSMHLSASSWLDCCLLETEMTFLHLVHVLLLFVFFLNAEVEQKMPSLSTLSNIEWGKWLKVVLKDGNDKFSVLWVLIHVKM